MADGVLLEYDKIIRAQEEVNMQDVTVNADNHIVTLSTCVSGEKNMRYLVQGVLLNE